MPDIVTHYVFGEKVLDKIDKKYKVIVEKHRGQFDIGTQGPDPYFYRAFQPWKSEKSVNEFGHFIHSNNTGKFFIKAIDYIKVNGYEENQIAYLFGFICHFALDKTSHPYIFHVTGEYNMEDTETYKYRGNHLRLERAIDSLFLERYLNKNPNNVRIDKEIFKSASVDESVVEMMDFVTKDIYNKEGFGNELYKSFEDMKQYLKFIHSKKGYKKRIFKLIDKLFNKKSSIVYETMFYYKNINRDIDYLNEHNNEWAHPCYEKETSTESFIELFNKGIEEAVKLLQICLDYFNDKINIIELGEIFEDISYSTGKSCNDENPMRYFNSVF